jgi:hypothetical protein
MPLKSGIFENRAAPGKSRIFLIADFSVMLFSFICSAAVSNKKKDRGIFSGLLPKRQDIFVSARLNNLQADTVPRREPVSEPRILYKINP